jgi:hypothetical protein
MNVKSITGVLTGKTFALVAGQERQQLLKSFWIAVLVLLIVAIPTVSASTVQAICGGMLISLVALVPTYLWCSGKASGMPIFPALALTYLWTYAVPVLKGNRQIQIYSPEQQLTACLTVAGYLALGTFVWYSIVKSSKPPRSKSYLGLHGTAAESFFLAAFVMSVLFVQGAMGGWFVSIDGGVFSLLRGTLLGLNSLATFVLSYRWGTREMPRKRIIVFVTILAVFMLGTAASLLIVGALTSFLLAAIGFSLGRRQVPVLAVFLALLCLVALHYGKGQMRAKYFAAEGGTTVQPWQYPAWFAEWIGYSTSALFSEAAEDDTPQSFIDRSSTIQLLLFAQQATDQGIPRLNGATYVIIPRLLVPRFLDPDKPTSHEGTFLLNLHYGIQTREDTITTTIGWGLLNEAYANFGLLGCAGLAIVLGLFYGGMARWSLNTPILSARSLFTMMLLNFAIQSEFSASVYLTALFQTAVPLGVVTVLFMKPRRFEPPITFVRAQRYRQVFLR